MKKIFLSVIILFLLLIISAPIIANASECSPHTGQQAGLVRCGTSPSCPCEISDFFKLLARIYEFIVKKIATPLAILALTIGGIMMLISAGNPNLLGKGKTILYSAIIGLVLVWGSWLIIDFVLDAIGYTENWSNMNI